VAAEKGHETVDLDVYVKVALTLPQKMYLRIIAAAVVVVAMRVMMKEPASLNVMVNYY